MIPHMGDIQSVLKVRETETRHTLIFAVVFGVFTLVAMLLTALVSVAIAFPHWQFATAAVFGVGGMTVAMILLTGIRRGRGQVARVVDGIIEWLHFDSEWKKKEIEKPVLPTPASPTLQGSAETFQYNHNGVGESVPRQLIHGFDPRDLAFLCRQLSRGFPFTERGMERLELPYSHAPMGKAEQGTHYTRFMQLCIDAGVIVGREAKKSGTLAVTEFAEILQKIKSVPEA